MARNKSTNQVTDSTGNVFADLGLPDAEEALAKARLAQRVTAVIDQRRLSQVQAAKLLGVDQPKISLLRRGRLKGFSSDRLFKFLKALDQDINIVIGPNRRRSKQEARLQVTLEA